ncbi:hypothetical protein CANARDRAFT_5135 [[Candida] arabinofermentans NRRL YB-2248]|uniref:Pre-mRNA-splicing factor CWC21 n=1 Tax=[Candida] arabinofermentans NRRL YB-2248 TaxID=983967 RepID=A0A1E4T7X5_9ASCO|nr:hypothetical protein CANARDRAFT_5135 [[Candida] arabinofermentans NRRL YB-2248]
MSYNGIGLNTAKGTGTNGYVQRNLSNDVSNRRDGTNGRLFLQREKAKASFEKRQNRREVEKDQALTLHERKRQVEVKVMEYRDELEEDESLDDEEIEYRVADYRAYLSEELAHQQSVESRRAKYRELKKNNELLSKRERSRSPKREQDDQPEKSDSTVPLPYNSKPDPFNKRANSDIEKSEVDEVDEEATQK